MHYMCIVHMLCVSALLVCTALHPQITCRHCSKFSVASLSIWTSQNSSTVSIPVVFDSSHSQAHWQVAWQLQFHCLSRLNPFIPCVCAFTYLSSSIIFTADTSSSINVQLSECSYTWACQYTGIHGAFQDNIPCTGAVVMINVELAQAHPNNSIHVHVHVWTIATGGWVC